MNSLKYICPPFEGDSEVWGGWLNFEFSKLGGKHSGWAIKTIYKKLDRGILKRIPLDPWFK